MTERNDRRERLAMLAHYRRSATCFLYFVRCDEFLKVGISTNPQSRISTMQGCNPYPLHLMAIAVGGEAEESEVHRAWKPYHHRAEWFHFEGEPRELCAAISRHDDPIEARRALGGWWLRRHGTHALTPRPQIDPVRLEDIDR